MNLTKSFVIFLGMCLAIHMVKANYDEKLAQDYLYASALAYWEPSDIEAGNCQAATAEAERLGMVPIFTLKDDHKKGPMHLVILKRDSTKEIIIAFSGVLNGNMEKILKKEEGEVYDVQETNKAYVFQLFHRIYKSSFREALLEQLTSLIESDEFKGYRIVYTGHSIGAALTFHAAADHSIGEYFNDTETYIYTFGQPRVGNDRFNRYFNYKIDEFYRIVNNRDPIPQLPPCLPDRDRGTCRVSAAFITNFCPYHSTTEVFYEKGMESFRVCQPQHGEDPDCSIQFWIRNIKDHNTYFGVEVATLHKTSPQEPNKNLQDLLKE